MCIGVSEVATENFNNDIPEDLLTSDSMELPGSSLSFVDGFPTMDSLNDAYDLEDMNRATSLFISMVPVASLEAIRKGIADFIDPGPVENRWVIFDDLMDSNSLFLTGNTDTVYAFGILDLEKSGPVVVEIPPNCDYFERVKGDKRIAKEAQEDPPQMCGPQAMMMQ